MKNYMIRNDNQITELQLRKKLRELNVKRKPDTRKQRRGACTSTPLLASASQGNACTAQYSILAASLPLKSNNKKRICMQCRRQKFPLGSSTLQSSVSEAKEPPHHYSTITPASLPSSLHQSFRINAEDKLTPHTLALFDLQSKPRRTILRG